MAVQNISDAKSGEKTKKKEKMNYKFDII